MTSAASKTMRVLLLSMFTLSQQIGVSPWYWWADVANYGHEFYERIFEVLLRLKANYLWPAMWNNAFNEDDPENSRFADEYGIVMGTSHQEPMLRAQKEWDRRSHLREQLSKPGISDLPRSCRGCPRKDRGGLRWRTAELTGSA